jgi:hypothetical protein
MIAPKEAWSENKSIKIENRAIRYFLFVFTGVLMCF